MRLVANFYPYSDFSIRGGSSDPIYTIDDQFIFSQVLIFADDEGVTASFFADHNKIGPGEMTCGEFLRRKSW
jgi:hypothetical protein